MSNRRRHRKSRARARRQMQVIQHTLILIAVIAVVFFLILNRVTGDRDKENSAAADSYEQSEETSSLPEEENTETSLLESTESAESEEMESAVSEEAESAVSEETESEAAEETEAAVSETEGGTTPIVTVSPEPDWLSGTSEEETELSQEIDTLNRTVEEAKERQNLLNLNDEELAAALREREVPEELIEFMQEYPETREFVVGYLFQPKTEPSMDISGEVTKGVIPHFLQWDPRWGYKMYGGSMMAVSACGPTAMSEVYSGLTGKTDMNPYEMAQWAENRGYHIMGSGTAWDMMASGASALGLNVWTIAASESAILETLRDGYPIIAAMAPGDFTYFGHFIVLVSADANGNISIRDSNSNIRTQRTWTADELLWQINQMWAYSYEMFPE